MTKLKNKKCLLETIDKLKNSDKNLSIAMLDMDNFKSINELFGYKTGDEFITKIGETIKKSELDAYRFGGDEFIILFSDNETKEYQEKVINNVLKNINETLNNHQIKNIYQNTAQNKINIYEKSDEKIKKLQKNKYKKEVLVDFKKNCKTEEARNDDYLFYKLNSFNNAIRSSYKNMINECILNEHSINTKNMLMEMKLKFNSIEGVKSQEIEELDEYFTEIYDKTANISRIKSWQKDFKNHNGFCATCGIASFDKNYLKDKTAKDLIEETGKILQEGKDNKKGRLYYKDISFGKKQNIIPFDIYKTNFYNSAKIKKY